MIRGENNFCPDIVIFNKYPDLERRGNFDITAAKICDYGCKNGNDYRGSK